MGVWANERPYFVRGDAIRGCPIGGVGVEHGAAVLAFDGCIEDGFFTVWTLHFNLLPINPDAMVILGQRRLHFGRS